MATIPFHHLNLMITDTCPLQCAHCCVESGPWRTTAMDLAGALSYVRQAHALNPRTVVSFTGGEPFVRFSLMRDIAREAHGLGMQHTTITSAVWCKSRAFARERLAELQAVGLKSLSISYDSFHEPWVSPEKVRHCVEAALDLDVRVFVGGSVTREAKGARELLADWLDSYPAVTVRDDAVQPVGRAALIPLGSLLMEDGSAVNPRCPMANELLIETDGSAYPCCSTGGDYAYLRLGDARETPLAELRERAAGAPWFQIIANEGFRRLEQIVQAYDPEVSFPTRYPGVCTLCKDVFSDDGLGPRVQAALIRHKARQVQSAAVSAALWQGLRGALAATGMGAPAGER